MTIKKTTKHTPGPWRTAALGDFITTEAGAPVAILESDNYRADGALIAAAPDLLQALREAASIYRELLKAYGKEQKPGGILERAEAAIAKAEGVQP